VRDESLGLVLLNLMQLGERQFSDGTTRPVYSSDDGRQYVLEADGEWRPAASG
jgi:hypothetical protein